MPCLFLEIHFPENHFPHFPMFDKHKENRSKETQFQSTKKIKRESKKVFSFLYSKENTFLFFINKKSPCPNKTMLPFSGYLSLQPCSVSGYKPGISLQP